VAEYSTLAAVDLGSNSFRLQVARVVGDQLYPLDGLRETVRLGAGLSADKRLDEASQVHALECLKRFGERLRGFPAKAVRAVGTNTLRVAKNAPAFLKKAESALGFPIEIIAGREEARLIYLGVAHGLPVSDERRLVIDIGGGSTEFIIGTGLTPLKLESLYMGCVSYTLRFFADGKITKGAMKQAMLAAATEIQIIASEFSNHAQTHWEHALASSGTARALGDILNQNDFGNGEQREGEITAAGLDQFRQYMIKVGDIKKMELAGLRADRAAVIAGGVAIMSAAMNELAIPKIGQAMGALRQGVLYDLLGRFHRQDMREVTVQEFMQRYRVDAVQARRVQVLAVALGRQLLDQAGDAEDREDQLRTLSWAALLHEVGISVAHSGYHKHSAYILGNADMPGFSKKEQGLLSLLALSHRGSLAKINDLVAAPEDYARLFALRLAALLHRSRSALTLPHLSMQMRDHQCVLNIESVWLQHNPLTETALQDEVKEWAALGFALVVETSLT